MGAPSVLAVCERGRVSCRICWKQQRTTRVQEGESRLFEGSGYTTFEVSQLANLCPESPEEARALIPTLQARDDFELQRLLTEMLALRTVG